MPDEKDLAAYRNLDNYHCFGDGEGVGPIWVPVGEPSKVFHADDTATVHGKIIVTKDGIGVTYDSREKT